MQNIVLKFNETVSKWRDFPLLFVRIVLVIGFYKPAMMKISNVSGIAEWFGGMGYPLPMVSAVLATGTEVLGVILLALGLGTRLISVPLMFVMLIAIFTVHISNGFASGDNGFEIPLYYFLMLFTLMVNGGGKLSLDYILFRKKQEIGQLPVAF